MEFPIFLNNNIIMSDEILKFYNRTKSINQTAQFVVRKTGCKEREAIDAVEDIVHMNNLKENPPQLIINKNKEDNDKLLCPKCGSKHIAITKRGVNFVWGFIGASKTINRCGICGYTWKPKL